MLSQLDHVNPEGLDVDLSFRFAFDGLAKMWALLSFQEKVTIEKRWTENITFA